MVGAGKALPSQADSHLLLAPDLLDAQGSERVGLAMSTTQDFFGQETLCYNVRAGLI